MPKSSQRKGNSTACFHLICGTVIMMYIVKRLTHREFKRMRTGKKEQLFYSSKEWISVRNGKRSITPLCEHCLKVS